MPFSHFYHQRRLIWNRWQERINIQLAGIRGDKFFLLWLEWRVSTLSPILTHYRYSISNIHRLQHGPGTPVPKDKAPRIRINLQQLDHFLSFITSPHLVQDLPFGEKHLELSSGKIIAVPNVIRTMIPERIVTQYIQFCSESNFSPFSRSTMLRILTECKASVRKSLQGLDYFAAEGARAFEHLGSIVD